MSKKREGLYLYCIIETKEKKSFGPVGIGNRGDEVYTVNYRDLAVVVSNTPIKVFTPVKKNALAHEKVIAGVMKEYTVIPMSFGVIFKTKRDIRALLEQAYPDIKEHMQKFKDRIELGLKVFWKKESFAPDIERENPEITELKHELAFAPPNEIYHAKIRLGSMVQSVVEKKRRYYTGEIFDPLSQLAVEARLNNTVGERMVLNSAFLVDRDREQVFDTKVNELYLKFCELLEFKYSGPWPPYNFVNLKLNFEP